MTRLALPLFLFACAEPALTPVDPGQAPPPTPPTLQMEAPNAVTFGTRLTLTVGGAVPGQRVELVRGTGVGDGPCPPVLRGACASITGVQGISGAAIADASGVATFNLQVARPATVGAEFYFQAVIRPSATAPTAQLSNVERVRVTDGSARLRVVHASPDAPPVDIYADGALLVPGAAWLDATPYLNVPQGTYTVDLRPAGAAASSPPIFTTQLALQGNRDTTVIAAGLLGSTAPADGFRLIATDDDWGAPGGLTYRARIVHASPDAPTVGIDVGADGSNEITGLARFADTGAAGVELPIGAGLQVATTAFGASLSFSVPGFTAGDEVTVIATGLLRSRANADDAFGLLAIDEDGVIGFVRQNPAVYALHASPDAPPVDIQAGGTTLVDDLAFRELSATVRVPPGAYILDVLEGASQGFVATIFTPTLNAGESYLAIATGFVFSSPSFQPILLADTATLGDDPTLQIVHASPDAPAVEIGVTAGGVFTPLTAPLEFTQQTGAEGIAVPPGTYNVAIALPGGPVLFTFSGLPLDAGDRYIAVATGALTDGSFGLTLVDPTVRPWRTITVAPD
jgi:hypothetical protein